MTGGGSELNAVNVQDSLDRWLTKEGSAETSYSLLYQKELGYGGEDTGIGFDRKNIVGNRRRSE